MTGGNLEAIRRTLSANPVDWPGEPLPPPQPEGPPVPTFDLPPLPHLPDGLAVIPKTYPTLWAAFRERLCEARYGVPVEKAVLTPAAWQEMDSLAAEMVKDAIVIGHQ